MFICRLFHRDQPFQELDVRLLADGSVTLGRDPSADWTVSDESGAVSRIHCTLSVEAGQLLLRDSSTNGTYLDDGSRAPRDIAVPIAPQQSLRFGALTLLVDTPPEADRDLNSTVLHLPFPAEPAVVPAGWAEGEADASPPRTLHRDASFLEAFCEGARLDASAFSGEDPVELMRRLGEIYQQAVLGIATLTAERARMKADEQLDRTTIGATDNNPFKWTSPRRIAENLLCSQGPGYLDGGDAVRASFADIVHHHVAIAAGANAAIATALAALDPAGIEQEADAQGFSLRSRHSTCRDIHARRHAALSGKDGDAARAFRDAYSQVPAVDVQP